MGAAADLFERAQKDRWPSAAPFHFHLDVRPALGCLTLSVLWVHFLVSVTCLLTENDHSNGTVSLLSDVFLTVCLTGSEGQQGIWIAPSFLLQSDVLLCFLFQILCFHFSHRMWLLLPDKHGVCNWDHCLWYCLDHFHRRLFVLLCNSPPETKGTGLPWRWECALLLISFACRAVVWQVGSNLTIFQMWTGKRNLNSSVSKKMAREIPESPYQVKYYCC